MPRYRVEQSATVVVFVDAEGEEEAINLAAEDAKAVEDLPLADGYVTLDDGLGWAELEDEEDNE